MTLLELVTLGSVPVVDELNEFFLCTFFCIIGLTLFVNLRELAAAFDSVRQLEFVTPLLEGVKCEDDTFWSILQVEGAGKVCPTDFLIPVFEHSFFVL